ncbi:ABC transporter substrate-binding protein [Phormidium tenue FACHB-886]|nr:ABC transporter substrate-binding protein [Phormidium tenue FACHB-886]
MINRLSSLQSAFSRLGRRRFLQMGLAAAATPVLASTLKGCASAEKTAASGGLRPIKFSHGFGLCNMPLFYSLEAGLFEKNGIAGSAVMGTLAGDQATQLASGQVQMAVVPFTNAIAAYTQAPTFQVVAGSGVQGLIVVAKPEIRSIKDLAGKKIAVAQADTLEVVVYDYLKREGMSYSDVEMVYIADATEATNAFIAGQVDALSSIEPYATKAKAVVKGNILGDGRDLYGDGYPDCVLAASTELIEKEPEVVKQAIATFFDAQYDIEKGFEQAAEKTIGKYYKTDMDSLLAAAQAQPPGVDIRQHKEFIFGRAQSMKEMGYITSDPNNGFVNFSLLEQVISEKPELLERVRTKSV